MLEQKAKMQLDHLRGMTPEEVARRRSAPSTKGNNEVTLTFKGKLLVLVEPLLPVDRRPASKRKVRRPV